MNNLNAIVLGDRRRYGAWNVLAAINPDRARELLVMPLADAEQALDDLAGELEQPLTFDLPMVEVRDRYEHPQMVADMRALVREVNLP